MTCHSMHRRSVLTLLGASAAAWPRAARAQQQRRLAVLMNSAVNDAGVQSQLATLVQGLRKLGWIEGRNLHLEVRGAGYDVNVLRAHATDLVGLFKPDLLFAVSSTSLVALQRATSTIPIVFAVVSDPVEQGFVPSLN